jgi:hypothetical protein
MYIVTASFFHALLPVLKYGYLAPTDMSKLCASHRLIAKLWSKYQRVCNLDWRPLCTTNPHWQEQQCIDDKRIDLRTAMLFHYDLDLATVHRRIGGNHVGAHRNPAKILARLRHLLEPKVLEELRRILVDGCPAKFNVEGTSQEFAEMLAYGNHPSLTKNLDKVMVTMNKEDKKDHVLTFPAWLAIYSASDAFPKWVHHKVWQEQSAGVQHILYDPYGFAPLQPLHFSAGQA